MPHNLCLGIKTLHVGAHQSTVTVIVLEEGDAGGSDRDHHSGRDVHIIDLLGVDLEDVVAAAGGDAGTLEVLGLVQRLVGLCHDILVLNVSGHILNFIGNDLIDQLAVFVVSLFDLAIGSLNEAVLVDLGVGCQKDLINYSLSVAGREGFVCRETIDE